MTRQDSAMFNWSWTEVSILGSQVLGRASIMESCAVHDLHRDVHLNNDVQGNNRYKECDLVSRFE